MIDAINFVETLNGKPVAVFGLGSSSRALIRALEAAGAKVVAGDDEIESPDLLREDFTRFACLIVAPGVPLHYPQPHPVVLRARDAGIEVIGDIEVFYRCRLRHPIIAITGTNGKSTTTALIGHILKSYGIRTQIGGNIGTPVFDLSDPGEDGAYVLEISSYQMDLCPTFSPHVSVLLNITPDHIDRHGSFEKYAASKARIFSGMGEAIIGVDDSASTAITKSVAAAGERNVVPISAVREVGTGIFVRDGVLYDRMYGEDDGTLDLRELERLRGAHNHQNIAAAYAVARFIGMTASEIYGALEMFPGLPHRQYLIRRIGKVAYINDSKATNADATSKALAAYDNIYLIAGGRPKEGGLVGLEPFLPKIKKTFLIGEAAADFSGWLDKKGSASEIVETIESAVVAAHKEAQISELPATVLLSPACASFDQFKNFEHRGDVFSDLVRKL